MEIGRTPALSGTFTAVSETDVTGHDNDGCFVSSFMIVAQPTGSEGTAVTQYVKTNGEHSARLHCRLICLLDPVLLKDDIRLSEIGRVSLERRRSLTGFSLEVTLFPLDHDSNDHREKQANLVWQKGTIRSAEGLLVSIWYAEMQVVQLEKFDPSCRRLLFNSTLCQLQFRLKIQVDSSLLPADCSADENRSTSLNSKATSP